MKHTFEQIHKEWMNGNVLFRYSSKREHISSTVIGRTLVGYNSEPYIHVLLREWCGVSYSTIRVLENTTRNICNLKRLVTNEIMYKLSGIHDKLISIRDVYSLITKGLVVDEYYKPMNYSPTGKPYCNVITYNGHGVRIEKYESTGNSYHFINHYGWFKEHGAKVEPYGLEIAQADFNFFMSLNWKNDIKRKIVKSDKFTLEQKFIVLKTMDIGISQCQYKSELLSQRVIYHPDECEILEPTVYIYTYKCMTTDKRFTKLYKHVLTVTADQFKSLWKGEKTQMNTTVDQFKSLWKGEKTQMSTKVTLTYCKDTNGATHSGDITELFRLYKKINTEYPFIYIEDEFYQFNETTLDYLVEKYKIPIDIETLKGCFNKGRFIQWCLKKTSFTSDDLDKVIHYGKMVGASKSDIKLLEDAKQQSIKEQSIEDIYAGRVSDEQKAIDIINSSSIIMWTPLYWGLSVAFGNDTSLIHVLCSIKKDIHGLATAITDSNVLIECCVVWYETRRLTVTDITNILKDKPGGLIAFVKSTNLTKVAFATMLTTLLKKGE